MSQNGHRTTLPVLLSCALALATSPACRGSQSRQASASKPSPLRAKVIRIGYPGVGIGGKPFIAGSVAAAVHGKRALETEFESDGIAIEWSLMKAAGPAINELISSHALDLTYLGDLPAIIGRAIGLDTKIVLAGGRGGNLYLVARASSPFRTLADLRGKRVVVFKGTALQLQADRILELLGFSEADFKMISMDQATGLAAILNGDVDALWAQYPIWEYVDKGDVRIVLNSAEAIDGKSQATTSFGVLLTTGSFEREHPDWLQRVVSVYLKEADWASRPAHREALFALWTRAGHPDVVFRKDADALQARFSPLLDDNFVDRVQQGTAAALRFGLIRKAIDVPGWFDDRYLKRALKDLGLEDRWAPLAAQAPFPLTPP